MPRSAIPLAFLLLAALPAAAQTAPPAEAEIGSWRLACRVDRMTDRAACALRHRDWVERPGGSLPGLSLEVIDRGGRLVPAVLARDLTLEGASRGLLALTGAAQLRFPPKAMLELPCTLDGRTVVCAPRAEDAARAEQDLLGADRALVRMVGSGGSGTAAEPVELRLSGTREAVARFAREAPPGSAPAESPGLDPREMVQKLLRLFGN